MTSGRYGLVLREVGRLLSGGTVAAMGEGQLLERFAAKRDATAFETLVSRHGPMVLGTCRRMLADPHDVEDAFQATFLVLARRAGSIRDADRLGPWLHGVARRVAARSRALSARRNARERPGGEDLAVEAPDASEAAELRVVLDEELARLPEKYRAPLVLCYLEGLTHDEAAQHLRWPVGTVRSRLAGGRDRLRARLTRRGLSPSAAVPAVLPRVSMPQALLSTTVRIATSAGSAPAHVATLAKGALVAMIWSKLKVITAVGLMAGLAVGGASVAAQKGGQDKASAPEPTPTVRELAEKLGTRAAKLEEKIDEARREIKQLDAEWHTTRTAIDDLRKQLDAERAGIEPPLALKDYKDIVTNVDKAKPGDGQAPTQELAPTARELSEKLRTRAEGVQKGLDDPDKEIKRLGAELQAVQIQNLQLRRQLKAAQAEIAGQPPRETPKAVNEAKPGRVMVPDAAKPGPAPDADGGDNPEAHRPTAFPMVMQLSESEILAFPPEHDRATVLNTETGIKATQRLPQGATEVSAVINFGLVALDLKGPEVRRIAVYDIEGGKWYPQDLKEPATESSGPLVESDEVTYRIGRFFYVFSVQAKKWGILELNRDPGPEFQYLPRMGKSQTGKWMVPEGDLIHIYDPKTGEWTHIDTKEEK